MYKILITSALLLVFGSSAYMSINGLCGVFPTHAWVIVGLGAGLEIGKILTATYLHRQWRRLNLLARSFYVLVVLTLCFLTSLEIMGYLSQQYAVLSQDRKGLESELNALHREAELLKGQIAVIDATLAGFPEGYVTRRIVERKQAGYDRKQERLLELTRKEAELTAELIKDRTYAAPLFSVARMMGLDHDRAARFLILLLVLVLEPLSIGLAFAASAVWQTHVKMTRMFPVKNVKIPKKRETENAETAEILPEKMPEMTKTAKTAFSVKTANPEKSDIYPPQNCRKNAENAETVKTAFPVIPAKTENAELHAVKEKFGLTEEKIARITGRNKVETVLQWLNNEKEIPEKALRELRRWVRSKNKVVALHGVQ